MLADCGVASRRKAEEMIRDGRVTINGVTAMLGDKVVPGKDVVMLDGEKVSAKVLEEERIYLMLHKPRGFITTMHDDRDRKDVTMLLEDVPQRVYPIGRLDKDSEGLLLFTNDGAFANKMMHPSGHVPKTYRVTVRPRVKESQLVELAAGVEIDGVRTLPATVRVLSEEPDRSVLEIILKEGRNRQIRKMCEQVGLEVARLKRTAVGPIKLGMLQPGEYRMLEAKEVKALKSFSAAVQRKAEAQKVTSKASANGNKNTGRRNAERMPRAAKGAPVRRKSK
jgi:23S rRNA pseudouridine2605 synthase